MADIDETSFLGIFHKKAVPDGATPIDDFHLERYYGTWLEIARFDFFWEDEDLTNVTATYSPNGDGTVKVLNRGYDKKRGRWSEYTGTAELRGDSNMGALSVRFFPGMNAGYNILSVDEDYQYALVAGRNLDFMWIFSRTATIPEEVKAKYLRMASEVGYDTSKLHWVDQTRNVAELA